MVPWCYRTATVNGLKNPACILHAPYCDIQDANEMRTVENAKRYETYGTDMGQIQDDSDIKKNTATRNEQRWGLIEKKNKIILNMILFRYSNEVAGYLILESQFSVVSDE